MTGRIEKLTCQHLREILEMNLILLGGAAFVVLGILAVNRAPFWSMVLAAVAVGVVAMQIFGLGLFGKLMIVQILLILALFIIPSFRNYVIVRPLYSELRRSFPVISDTEREALAAGTVGWDAQLFSGTPDWSQLRAIPAIELSDEEQAFLDGPTERLCAMLDEWDMRHNRKDVPDEVWSFIRENGFFGMLISKEYGGLGFSAQAQSLVLGKIASKSPDIAIVVMVPNSLGPGELVEKYGTPEQKQTYLHRLARGDEIPCFALTSPNAGSDAAAMRDVGLVCMGEHEGEQVLGVRLTWSKRYITLAPRATLLGLAFNLYDPDKLLELGKKEIGITLALIPTSHRGVNIGRRHLPCGSFFPNGPTSGEDVFIPIDWIIGGQERAGHGWGMLMESLAVGRAISLPATSAAAIKAVLRSTSAYARLRRQFSMPIGKMEGVEEVLARMVENAYVVEAARAMTAAMLKTGQKPSVISALLKFSSTERMRDSINDAMDIHGGRAICDGPANYLQTAYQSVPVGVTVEGANILTRTLITFAQGALRCHPYLYRETEALQDRNEVRGMARFETAFYGHMSWSTANAFAALGHNLSGGRFVAGPDRGSPEIARWYRQLGRASRSFAFVADLTVGLLAGGLKTKQKITGRMADALAELYLLSATLKRFEDDGAPDEDLLIVEMCAQNALHRFDAAIAGVIDNFPMRMAAWVMKLVAQPLGAAHKPARDRLGRKVVAAVLQPGEQRDRLTRYIHVSKDPDDALGILEYTLEKAVALERPQRAIEKAVRRGYIQRHHRSDWFRRAVDLQIIKEADEAPLRELDELIGKVIAVDAFFADEVAPHHKSHEGARGGEARAQAKAEAEAGVAGKTDDKINHARNTRRSGNFAGG